MAQQTAMKALVELLKVKDIYKECMPYILEIIEEVYIPMEKEQIINAHNHGEYFSQFREDGLDEVHGIEYYNETYNK
jgi:hypothetical protein